MNHVDENREAEPRHGDQHVRLRRWRMTDLSCVEVASRERRITEATTVPAVFTEEAGRAWISKQHHRSRDGQGWSLAITDTATDRAIGCVVLLLRAQPGVAGVGYWLTPEARGRGHASRAVGLVTSWALGAGRLARVEAWVEPGNLASVAVLSRCGFELEGRLRSSLSFESRRADALVFSKVADV